MTAPPRRVGRPTSPDTRMAATLRLRMSARERADLEARAAAAGVDVPAYVRMLLWPPER